MSLAAFRRSPEYDELGKLAEEHFKHDLDDEDRNVLIRAAKRISTPAVLGSLVGIGLGVWVAFRLRRARLDIFNAFRAAEKPTQVVFANGRTEAVPDITPFLQPSRFGDIATYLLCTLGGLFVGGETGLLTGTWLAARSIKKDPARQKKIENAYRKFKVDYLRKQADRLEAGGDPFDPTPKI